MMRTPKQRKFANIQKEDIFDSPLTPSRLSTESGLERSDAAPETLLNVLLWTSRLKEPEEKKKWKRKRTESVPMTRRRPGWTPDINAVASSTIAEVMLMGDLSMKSVFVWEEDVDDVNWAVTRNIAYSFYFVVS
eukprot:1820_1